MLESRRRFGPIREPFMRFEYLGSGSPRRTVTPLYTRLDAIDGVTRDRVHHGDCMLSIDGETTSKYRVLFLLTVTIYPRDYDNEQRLDDIGVDIDMEY